MRVHVSAVAGLALLAGVTAAPASAQIPGDLPVEVPGGDLPVDVPVEAPADLPVEGLPVDQLPVEDLPVGELPVDQLPEIGEYGAILDCITGSAGLPNAEDALDVQVSGDGDEVAVLLCILGQSADMLTDALNETPVDGSLATPDL